MSERLSEPIGAVEPVELPQEEPARQDAPHDAEASDREQVPAQTSPIGLRAQAWRPADANLQHAFTIALLLVACVGLSLLSVLHAPAGFFLFVFVLPCVGWIVLAAHAMQANRALGILRRDGVVVGGELVGLTRDEGETRVRFAYDPVWDADDAPLTRRCQGEQAIAVEWMSRRYAPGMRVAVLYPPESPEQGVLYPPPGGGTTTDLLGDCVAWLIGGGASADPAEQRDRDAG